MRVELEYPPSTTPIRFITNDGKHHTGFFVKDINKYIRGVYRWKDVDTGQWYDDDEVLLWSAYHVRVG